MAVTLCGASRVNRKYYFNPDFDRIPADVQEHLREICVLFAEDVGGIFTIEFGEDGMPRFVVRPGENDTDLDEIGADLRVKKLQEEEAELMRKLALFYHFFIDGGKIPDDDKD